MSDNVSIKLWPTYEVVIRRGPDPGPQKARPPGNVTWGSNLAAMQYVVGPDKLTLTQTATSSNKVYYRCTARSAG